MAVRENSPESDEERSRLAVNAEDFKKRLADEYKLLQDKIDKIGAFRFTIKGWSVTAVIAVSAASSNAKSLFTVLFISGGLAVMLIFFFQMELSQVKLSRLFGDRARRLENAFVRFDKARPRGKLPFPVPYTVNEIALSSRNQRILVSGRLATAEDRRQLLRKMSDGWRLWRSADLLFYVVLLCLAAAIPIPHHAEISKHFVMLRTKIAEAIQTPPRPAKKP